MRALSADAPSIRGTGLKAGVLMVRGPGSSKAVELMAVFDALLDKADLPAHFEYGILSLYGELGRNLGSAPLEKLLNRLDGQLSSESESVGKGAALSRPVCAAGRPGIRLLEFPYHCPEMPPVFGQGWPMKGGQLCWHC